MIHEELSRIETLGERVEQLIDAKEFSKAERLARQLRGSVCVTEAMRLWVRLTALAAVRKGEPEKAFSVVRDYFTDVWGYPDAIRLASFVNDPVSPASKHFYLEITGCWVQLGFSGFGPDYVITFEAIAKSVEEAIAYFFALVPAEGQEQTKLVSKTIFCGLPAATEHEGLLRTHPFRPARRSELKRSRAVLH